MSRDKCPVCDKSNFYESDKFKIDPEIIPVDDAITRAFGSTIDYSVCKNCKNIQFYFKHK